MFYLGAALCTQLVVSVAVAVQGTPTPHRQALPQQLQADIFDGQGGYEQLLETAIYTVVASRAQPLSQRVRMLTGLKVLARSLYKNNIYTIMDPYALTPKPLYRYETLIVPYRTLPFTYGSLQVHGLLGSPSRFWILVSNFAGASLQNPKP